MSTWWEYVQRVSGGLKPAQIAEKMGGKTAVSTVNSWKTSKPKWESVLGFAAAFKVSKQAALCAAYLDGEEVDLEAFADALPDRIIGAQAFKRLGAGAVDQLDTSIHTPGVSS